MSRQVIESVDLFSYTNVYVYLKDLADAWVQAGHSMQLLGLHCGFSSPNFIQQLINGKRQLTEAAGEKMSSSLKWPESKRRYLALMIQLSRAADPKKTDAILVSMKRAIGKARRTSVADTTIFDHWLYGIVFEMFRLKQVSTQEDLLSQEFRVGVTRDQLHGAFEFLSRRGYLKQKGEGWEPALVEFQPQNDIRRINSQQNHLKFFSFAQHRLHDALDEREFQGLSLAVRGAQFPELKERVRQFVRTIGEEFGEDESPDEVIRLQIGVFKILK